MIIVFKERIYKIWKQFTTKFYAIALRLKLCSKNEYTKSESNSQQDPSEILGKPIVFKERIYKIWKQFTTTSHFRTCSLDCVQRTNIQNLKAIHNPVNNPMSGVAIVFKERIYKIWKQFTTRILMCWYLSRLCSKNEYTKSESNSQLTLTYANGKVHCVQRTNIQNLKAIHNRGIMSSVVGAIVFKERIYKIWKQFTTPILMCWYLSNCVQRTNIQNLKAIHNKLTKGVVPTTIVFKERIYKIWKQFTT